MGKGILFKKKYLVSFAIILIIINFLNCSNLVEKMSVCDRLPNFPFIDIKLKENIENPTQSFLETDYILAEEVDIIAFDNYDNKIAINKGDATIQLSNTQYTADKILINEITIIITSSKYQNIKISVPLIFDEGCNTYNPLYYYFFLEKQNK